MILGVIYLCTLIFEKTHLDLITCQKTRYSCLVMSIFPLGGKETGREARRKRSKEMIVMLLMLFKD